ncbi:MAG: PTS sugar transporter subunit IIC/EAL domain-containing protein [Treponema sp.]|nr:PTS sugar transporter subunit IIC/EAL domain-containing protein [Treponema sp.]
MIKKVDVKDLFFCIPQSIKNGLVMVIQVLMIGSFACLLENIQIPLYQEFIKNFANGSIFRLLMFIDNSTIGMLSVYTTISISVSYVRLLNYDKNSAPFACAITSLACFFIMIGFFETNISQGSFNINMFSGRGMFSALIASVFGSFLFHYFIRLFSQKSIFFADGTDSIFNTAISNILPATCVISIFALFNYLTIITTNCSCVQDLFVIFMNKIFEGMERSYFSGLLFIFLSQLMWFVGIHGSNLLEQVAAEKFTEITGSIVSKSFIDNFVIMGGCGTTIALLIAILLFSKRRTSQKLATMSAGPIFFNINELIVFGLPIVYNTCLFIPFVVVPLIMYTVSYFAVYLNLVDITINKIHWTTPIILSGYQATGSISGSILQIINVIIAVLIYKPFILLYDKKSDSANAENMNSIIEILKTSEENLIPITLTELKSPAGILAKNLVNDIKEDLQKENIQIKFQPQYNKLEQCIGTESLLRWTHPIYGTVYPPLVLKLAKESNLLWDLESFILELCIKNLEHFNQKFGSDFKLSVNITVATFYNPAFLPFLEKMLKKYNVIPQTLCLEITEEMKLENNKETNSIFNKIKELGCKIALDDFSMGHTSLKYLQDNHFDSVKIDGSLVKAMLNNSRSKDIIASIMFLANSLDFEVIAEFVETKFERKTLESLGCSLYQGYYYGEALSLKDFLEKIK